jgi:hypothetical protein
LEINKTGFTFAAVGYSTFLQPAQAGNDKVKVRIQVEDCVGELCSCLDSKRGGIFLKNQKHDENFSKYTI